MHATILFSIVVALAQGACGFVSLGQVPATPAHRVDSGILFRRQEVCDSASGCTFFCFRYVFILGVRG